MAHEQLKFEVRNFYDQQGRLCRGIFIDGRHFDWGVDEESYKDAVAMGPKFQRAIEASIAAHFIDSLSEFMNRRVTQDEVNEAQKTGWIKK